MKLIDLLVQELPKRGGWPDNVMNISMHGDGALFSDGRLNNKLRLYGLICSDGWAPGMPNGYTNAVSKEQYEAALAASKQVAWDGAGSPPVGVTCEHCPGGTTQKEWEVVTVLGISKRPGGMFTDYWLRKEDGSSYIIGNPYRFRPIRTEAERKREDIIKQMSHSLRANGSITTEQLDRLYDDIANGNIFGIKLAD